MSVTYSLPAAYAMPDGSLKVAAVPGLAGGIVVAGRTGAGQRRGAVLLRIDDFDLVVVRVGQIDQAIVTSDAQRMLEANLCPAPSTSPKVNSRLAGRSAVPRMVLHFALGAGQQRHGSNRASFAIGDEQPAAVGRQTARLGERREADAERLPRQQRTIDDVFARVAGEGADFRFVQRHFPNLMRAGHGDVQILSMNPDVPRTAQRRLPRPADKPLAAIAAGRQFLPGLPSARPAVLRLPAGAGDRRDALLLSSRPCAADGFRCRRRRAFRRSGPCLAAD